MKKVSIIISLAFMSAFISCDSDDDTTVEDAVEETIEEVSCETTLEGLEATVEEAITAFEALPEEETCQTLKTAIEAYRTNDCGDEDAYAENYDLLTDDCLPPEAPEVEEEMEPVEEVEEEMPPVEEVDEEMPPVGEEETTEPEEEEETEV